MKPYVISISQKTLNKFGWIKNVLEVKKDSECLEMIVDKVEEQLRAFVEYVNDPKNRQKIQAYNERKNADTQTVQLQESAVDEERSPQINNTTNPERGSTE